MRQVMIRNTEKKILHDFICSKRTQMFIEKCLKQIRKVLVTGDFFMQFEIKFFEKRRIWKELWRAYLNTEGSNDLSKKISELQIMHELNSARCSEARIFDFIW